MICSYLPTKEDKSNLVAFVGQEMELHGAAHDTIKAVACIGNCRGELVEALYPLCTLCPVLRRGKKVVGALKHGLCKWCEKKFFRLYKMINFDDLSVGERTLEMMTKVVETVDFDELSILVRLKDFLPYELARRESFETCLEFVRNLYVGELLPLTRKQEARVHWLHNTRTAKFHYERVNAEDVVGIDLVDLTDAQLKSISYCYRSDYIYHGHQDQYQRFDVLWHSQVGESITVKSLWSGHSNNFNELKTLLPADSQDPLSVYTAFAVLRNHYTTWSRDRCIGLLKRLVRKAHNVELIVNDEVWPGTLEELNAAVYALE